MRAFCCTIAVLHAPEVDFLAGSLITRDDFYVKTQIYSLTDLTIFLQFQAESISLHDCISETLTLAPRDICARANTFMLENRRSFQNGDREALNMHVVSPN